MSEVTGTSVRAVAGSPRTVGELELIIGGMTCAACAARVERRLNRIDGVHATVNFATEKARVSGPVGPEELITAVRDIGYSAELPAVDTGAAGTGAEPDVSAVDTLRTRLLTSLLLSVPVIVMAMVPAAQFPHWQWLSLVLAAPVVVWGGWPFHRAALLNLRHGAASMDTLVSMGTAAAFGWSLYALFFGHAGMPGMTHAFSLTVVRGEGSGNI